MVKDNKNTIDMNDVRLTDQGGADRINNISM